MKILLIEPIYFFQRWLFETYGTKNYFQVEPLSLLQLAAFYPDETTIIDGMNDKKITPKKLSQLLVNYNKSDNIIGIAAHSNVSAVNTLYTLKLVKSYAPLSTTILGGYHATFFDQLWIKLGADIVIRNEAEITYSNLVDKIKKIQNNNNNHDNNYHITEEDLIGATYFKGWFDFINKRSSFNYYYTHFYLTNPKEWKSIFNIPVIHKERDIIAAPDRAFCKNLDDFPFPIRTKLKLKKNSLPIHGRGYASSIEMVRGCPFNCEFCSTRVMWKRNVRYKSVKRIIQEIKECKNLGIEKLLFVDESWGANRKHTIEFLKALEYEKLNIKWAIQIRADTIIGNPDIIKMAGSLGCRVAFVGYESLNQDLLNLWNKGTHANKYWNVRKILKDAGILVLGYFLIGLPGESKQDRKNTIYTMNYLSDVAFLQQYVPYFKEIVYEKQGNNRKELTAVSLTNGKKSPTFMLDTQHIDQSIKDHDYNNRIIEITNEIRKNHFRFLLNPRHLLDILFAKNQIQKSKKELLLFMYKRLIENALRFNPKHFLYLFRGK